MAPTNSHVGGPADFDCKVNDANSDSNLVYFAATVSNVNDAPTGTVQISGTVKQNHLLTAVSGISDADGLGESGVGRQKDGGADGNGEAGIHGNSLR